MRGTPTFEHRPDPDRLHIVRVGVEYPPDATPDAPLPGEGQPALLELHARGGMVRTDATHRGFALDWPHASDNDADWQCWLVYVDGAGRTCRARVRRSGLGVPEPYDPNPIDWGQVDVVKGDVRMWPEA